MIKKVISFGDSFLYGSELQDCVLGSPSALTWPSLFANDLSVEYECLALPGHSAQHTLRSVLDNLDCTDCFFTILWPSANRFEYYDKDDNRWIQLNPNNILTGNSNSKDVHKTYYTYMNSLLNDKLQNLICIYTAIQALSARNIKFSMSVISDFIYTEQWFNPPYVQFLQEETQSYIKLFDNLTFVEWADFNNYATGPGGHPLEEAHQCAYKYLKSTYKELSCG